MIESTLEYDELEATTDNPLRDMDLMGDHRGYYKDIHTEPKWSELEQRRRQMAIRM